MKERIARAFERLSLKKEKGLALFVTAGYPSLDSTPGIVAALEEGGVDIIELGIPFSDPLADGPVIQESSARALANGVTLKTILKDIREIRRKSEIPIVLMGYLNPILRYGAEKFLSDAAEAGADGMVLPEIPLEEFPKWDPMLRKNHLAGILLVAPTSGAERIRAIDRASEGFLYCVSTTGVTGGDGFESAPYLPEIRKVATKNRLMVGFGISTPEDGMKMARHADGVVVGSALIRYLSEGHTSAEIAKWVWRFQRILNAES